MKKLFTLFLALVASVSAIYASDIEVDGIWYDFDNTNNTATVTYRGSSYYNYNNEYSGSVVIPPSVTYNGTTYSVTSIGDWAFAPCSSLTSVTIPNSVTSIGSSAFKECSSLTSITIPNSVLSIGGGAFAYCSSLTSITISDSVTSIGEAAFYKCSSLTSVDIGNSVTSIGRDAFEHCSELTSITIPNSVTSIGERAFSGCSSLTSVVINSDAIVNKEYTSSDNLSDVFGSQVTKYIIGTNVKGIGKYAFYNCSSLASVTIGNSVTSIGEAAFYGTSIYYNAANWVNDVLYINNCLIDAKTSISGAYAIMEGTRVIADCAFEGCESLTSITIGNSVTSIGEAAFYKCSSLTSVTIPNSVTSIGGSAFKECSSLTSVNITDLAAWCKISFGSSINTNPLYYAHNLYLNGELVKDLVIPNSVTSIGDYAFSGCSSLTSVTIPNNVTSIGKSAFAYCSSLTSITIPNSVKTIGASAFKGCARLGEVSLGKGLETIGANAFAECTRLYDIYVYATYPPFAEESSFANYNVYVYIPCEYQRDYTLDVVWGKFKFIECISSDNVTTDEIVVTPSENEANVIWPAVSGAATYELVIKDKNGNIVCTLIFNANGQLTSIAFNAPSRNGAPAQTQNAGFSFTITGLDSGTGYDLTLTAKDNSGNIIEETTIPFHTNWAEGIEDVQGDEVQSTKVIKDGQVLILRNGKTYTMQGVEVK